MHATGWTDDLLVSRLVVTWLPSGPVSLGRWPANGLRGAFGASMWALACVNPSQDCTTCRQALDCPIPSWFDPGQLAGGGHDARPFALWAEPRDHDAAPVQVELLFLGPMPRPALVLEALARMGRAGFGAQRVPCALHQVQVDSTLLWNDGPTSAPFPEPHGIRVDLPDLDPDRPATLLLRTPVQLARHAAPSPAAVLDAGISRLRSVLRSFDLPQPPHWPPLTEAHASGRLVRVEQARPASAGGRHDLSGYAGELHVHAPVGPWADLLQAMSVLGAGRGTSAGLGRIAIRQP